MITLEIRSEINAIEKETGIREEIHFVRRAEAIDFLEFNVIERIEGLLQEPNPKEILIKLKQDAERIKHRLEDIDENLFRRLRAEIRMAGGEGKSIHAMLDEYVGLDSRGSRKKDEIGYDCLDTFINGLLHFQPIPVETKAREPGMVYFQKTPARITLEMVDKAQLTNEDVFYDLGSGLGQVPVLVNLLSGAKAKGIEFEPAYCDYARACAIDLNLSRVEFILADARTADYSTGTAYFMYSSFEGKILEDVLEKLKKESPRRIKLFTYGPCTPQVSQQTWLRRIEQNVDDIHRLGVFVSH
ncbi:MAG: hypothetical protein ABIW76_21260 [Fibrobacteria bacterium]